MRLCAVNPVRFVFLSLWLLPFFVLLPLRIRSFVLLTIADVGVFFTIYPLTLVIEASDPLRTPFLAGLFASVGLRVVALIVIWRDIASATAARQHEMRAVPVPAGGPPR